MNYKLKEAIRKQKKYFIIYAILWIFITIVFVMPIAYSITEATVNSQFNIQEFFDVLANQIMQPLNTLSKIFAPKYIGMFSNCTLKFTIVFLIIAIIGIVRNAPKTEYENIEHGSSDWCARGEQYKVLSNKNGIILAEDNYLPVNKRGNVNVLVVGRFRFW